MLRPTVVCLSVTYVLWVAKRRVLEQSYYWQPIHEVVCEESIGTKMNDLDLSLEVV